MKKVTQQIMEIRPEVVFEVHNKSGHDSDGDPTTSLGATTFTGLLTVLATIGQKQPALRK